MKSYSIGREVNLFDMYPKTKRDVEKRWKEVTMKDRLLARQFEKEFFVGTRNQGYGGYTYQSKYTKPIVKRMQEFYGLTEKSKILDVGSGMGFLLHEFKKQIPGITVAGLEISKYGVNHTMKDVKSHVVQGNAKELPYANNTFDLVLAINTIHNLPLEDCYKALQEIERVSKKDKYIIVDSWKSKNDRERMFKWVLTGITYFSTEQWKELFEIAGYTGDFYWFIA